MLRRCALSLCVFLLLLPAVVCGQQSSAPKDLDFASFLKETQQSVNEPGYAGLVWWIPTEYWEISSERSGMPEEKAAQRYAPLRKYTVVAVALGKIGIGNINWFSEPDIRDNVRFRDADGNMYPPVQKLSGDAEGLVAVLKVVFGNMLGTMGQNIQLLFFSATNKMAKPIADPTSTGEFSVIVSKVIEGKDKKFEWKLPLTALSPPKYCPVGKERLQANWKYCPWHGVRLDEQVGTAAAPN